jgi:transposase/transcriptional regulator with XRE-family HTH domain
MTPEELNLRRRRLNLTKRELGALLGVKRETISAWELGKRFPPATMIDKALTFVELEVMVGSEAIVRLESQFNNEVTLPRVIRHTHRALKDDEAKIRAALTAYPNATLTELCELVKAAGGASASVHTMGREVKRLNLSLTRKGPIVRSRILKGYDDAKIREIVEEHPYATLAELCAALKDAGGPSVSLNTMSRALKRLKPRPPKPTPGRYRMLQDYEAEIRSALAAHPKATLTELCEIIKAAGGPNVSRETMKRALKLLQLKLKDRTGQQKESYIQHPQV